MSASHVAILADRGIVSVTGEDAKAFLDNLITNDMDDLDRQPAIHAALLTPQGKILFEFFVVRSGDGFLLDTLRASVADLIKRLSLYRLRAKVSLNDLSSSRTVVAAWGAPPPEVPLAISYRDPRADGMGHRMVMASEMAAKLANEDEGRAAYDRHRIALGVPEPERDYAIGDTFPHEAGFDRQAGVSFSKGCFVGQEVVARMQHKTLVRKRIARISGEDGKSLVSGAQIAVGQAVIGRVGSVDGSRGLALVRLDRAVEAAGKGQSLTSDGVGVRVDDATLAAYEAAAKARSAGAT
ncbi:MAG: folate-binding protein YgfZ [Hyphomicrobiaceae bacterium]